MYTSMCIVRRYGFRRFSKCFSSLQNKHSDCNIIRSEVPNIEIPNIRIPEFIYQNFNHVPEKVAIECSVTGKKYTFQEVRRKSENLGVWLKKALNLKKGDVIAVLLPNIPEYSISILGPISAGLVVTTLNSQNVIEEISRHLTLTEAKAIITLTSQITTHQLDKLQIPIIAIQETENDVIPKGVLSFNELTESNASAGDIAPIKVDNEEIAVLPSSGGTSGIPKAVELTHKNLIANILQMQHPHIRRLMETTDNHQDVLFGVLPFFHIYGLTAVLLASLHYLCKIVTFPKFRPELFIQSLIDHKPHVLHVVPHMITFLSNSDQVKEEYLASVRTVYSGAAPLGALDEEKFMKKLKNGTEILQAYGLTETSPVVTVMDYKKAKKLNCRGSIGEPIPNTSLKVISTTDDSSTALGPNQHGEILIKGPQVMRGYYKQPKATKEVLVDGWLKTGDIGYYDNNKMFYITDRLKDLIKVKGFQVAPAELEAIIRDHPSVSEAAVIGIPDNKLGEVPKAFVVLKNSKNGNPLEIEKYVAAQVADYKQLRGGVVILNSLPKSSAGKILRKDLANL